MWINSGCTVTERLCCVCSQKRNKKSMFMKCLICDVFLHPSQFFFLVFFFRMWKSRHLLQASLKWIKINSTYYIVEPQGKDVPKVRWRMQSLLTTWHHLTLPSFLCPFQCSTQDDANVTFNNILAKYISANNPSVLASYFNQCKFYVITLCV